MWLKQLCNRLLGSPAKRAGLKAGLKTAPTRRRSAQLGLERLEDRSLPSSYTAASVSDLVADMNAANLAGGSNTIALAAGTTFALTAVNDTTDGATALPRIVANDNLTILGNGALIERSAATGTPAFRLFDVASGASLSLQGLTLQGGLALGAGVSAEGGAIYSQGALSLSGVTVQNNVAQGAAGGLGQPGQPAAGGGIYSAGALTLQGNTIVQNNQANGGQGGQGGEYYVRGGFVIGQRGGAGGNASGGGLYVGGGTATLTNTFAAANTVQGGDGGTGGFSSDPNTSGGGNGGHGGGTAAGGGSGGGSGTTGGPGGNGGNAFGGGLYAGGGTITLVDDSVTQNSAQAGMGGTGGSGNPNGAKGSSGLGEGGGLYIDAAVLAYLDTVTQASFKHNHASTSDPDIYGSYSTYP
jgi:hypothetical protein